MWQEDREESYWWYGQNYRISFGTQNKEDWKPLKEGDYLAIVGPMVIHIKRETFYPPVGVIVDDVRNRVFDKYYLYRFYIYYFPNAAVHIDESDEVVLEKQGKRIIDEVSRQKGFRIEGKPEIDQATEGTLTLNAHLKISLSKALKYFKSIPFEVRGVFADFAMYSRNKTKPIGHQISSGFIRGGIDLSQQDSAMRITKDASGGVQVDVDPALIARVERDGMTEVDPVIIGMRPADIQSLFGVIVLTNAP